MATDERRGETEATVRDEDLAPRVEAVLRLPRESGAVSVCRRFLQTVLGAMPVDGTVVDDVLVSISEACANAVEHASGGSGFELRIDVDPSWCRLAVSNAGAFDVASIPRAMPQPTSTRGRGLPIMRASMDSVVVRSNPDHGTTVELAKRLR